MMRKYHTQFTEKNLTGNAGITHFGRFAEKLGVEKTLERFLSIERAGNCDYSAAAVIIMLVMGVLAGCRHLSHLVIIKDDPVLTKLFNWAEFPVDTTFSRIFKLFSHKHCNELSDAEAEIRNKVWSKRYRGRVTCDMDSTVRGVSGAQEGARKGFNSKKKGQKSYHPLLCFIAETRECLHSWFRSGDAYSANGCVEFMKECMEKLPKRVWKVVVRADSAFFNGALMDYLESMSAEYLIKVKMKGLEPLLASQKWKKVKNRENLESCTFEYQCAGWKHPRRFAAIREIIFVESEDLLFPEPRVEYNYFCYVTNLNLSPYGARKFYGKRAASENWIEWCKNQMASGSILTNNFWADSAIFQTCILAYNLMVWMMRLTDEKGFYEEPNTIRMFLISVPARLIHRGRQWFLKLSKTCSNRKRWEALEIAIEAFAFS